MEKGNSGGALVRGIDEKTPILSVQGDPSADTPERLSIASTPDRLSLASRSVSFSK